MKIIASDMDGTLLNENATISQENATAIKKAQEEGVEVVIATGRPYNSALKFLQEAGLECPIISLNGAEIRLKQGELIREVPLDKSIAKEILTVCKEKDIYCEFYTKQGVISDSREKFIQVMVDVLTTTNPDNKTGNMDDLIKHAEQRIEDEQCQFIPDYDALFNEEKYTIYKILAFSKDSERLEKMYLSLKDKSELAITSSAQGNLEFNNPEAQKGFALKYFANSLDIDLKHAMAIGDNLNDKSMLLNVGKSVAMGNALDEIKSIADFITRSNNEDGVAYAIHLMLDRLI